MILVIDNYDSFVHNLARYLCQLGVATEVVRNDQISVAEVRAMRPRAIVLSPGPCSPDEAGRSLELVGELHRHFPMLGVCLGHQTIAQALGGRVIRSPRPRHGIASTLEHNGEGLFEGLPPRFQVGRYHSLVVDPASLPPELVATAWTEEGMVMALAHRHLPLFGVQFHPESVLTEHGYAMLGNFLRRCGIPVAHVEHPIVSSLPTDPVVEPGRVVTF